MTGSAPQSGADATGAPAGQAECCLVYMTAPSWQEASSLARSLVKMRLAAGVNLLPGTVSVYRWQDAVLEKGECIMIAQVAAQAVTAVRNYVEAHHSYMVPCLIVLPITDGIEKFLVWIKENSRP